MWWLILIVVVVAIILLWVMWQSSKTKDTATSVSFEGERKEVSVGTEPVLGETLETETVHGDDLTVIEGIGPKVAEVLQQAGIVTFRQLSQEDPVHLRQILDDAGLRLSDPTTWPRQAKLAASGNWDGLKALQESLRGGREV